MIGTMRIPIKASVLIIGSCFASSPGASSVCGTIANNVGDPLTHATMSILQIASAEVVRSGQAGQGGRVCLDDVPDGLYMIEASAPGYTASRYSPVRVQFPGDTKLEFRLPVGTAGGD